MDNSTSNNIELFFEDPAKEPRPRPTRYGILYLLRRDIEACFGVAEFPATMAILAGIDLLGKFYAGDDDTGPGKVGHRFTGFLKYFDDVADEEKKVLYQFRNSLLHSFGLYSKDRQGNVYIFTLSKEYPLLVRQNGEKCYINPSDLKKEFELSIKAYYEELYADPKLQQNFNKMFPKYGIIYMT